MIDQKLVFKQELYGRKKFLGGVIKDLLDSKIPEAIKPGTEVGSIRNLVRKCFSDSGVSSIENFVIDSEVVDVPVHISLDNVLCHGNPADDRKLLFGELVRVDLVAFNLGIYADAARTYVVGEPNEEQANLLLAAKECVWRVIKQLKANCYLSDIAQLVTATAKEFNVHLGPKQLCGHYIGDSLHKQPVVLNYYDEDYFKKFNKIVYPGDVLCLEPILTTRKVKKIEVDSKGQIVSLDFPGYIAHYEQMIQFEIEENIVYTG